MFVKRISRLALGRISNVPLLYRFPVCAERGENVTHTVGPFERRQVNETEF